MLKYLLLLLLVSTPVLADCTVQCPVTKENAGDYFQSDHFRWTDYDQDVHMLAGLSGSLIIGEVLIHYFDVSPWEAAIMSSIAMGMIGTTKEVMFDTYTSRTDIKTWWIGGIVGGATLVVLHF